MMKFSIFPSIVPALAALAVCSCQQSVPASGGSVGVRNYSDAVTHIGQVDPAYRQFFSDQNAANYSLNDQRKAYIAAAQTARTPVRESDYRPSDVRRVKPGKARIAKGKTAVKRRTVIVAKKPKRRR